MDVQKNRCLCALVVSAGMLLTATQTGCVGLLGHLGYWTGGSMVEAEYDDLEGRRVAVICVSDSTSYGSGTEDRTLAQMVARRLGESVDDIELVSASEVADWIDHNDWNSIDYREAGKGLKADRVVAIDLSGLSLYEDRTLYKGRAQLTITVFDMTRAGKEVFRRNLPEITHPSTGYYHTTDTSEATFRKIFLGVLADRTARFFKEYDAMDIAGPSPALL